MKTIQRYRRRVSLLLAAAALSLPAVALHAQTANGNKAKPVEMEVVPQTSAELSAELGNKWGKVLTEGYGLSEQGLKMFVGGYANYPQDVLKNALNAKNFEAMNRTLMGHNQTLVNALAEKIRNEEGTMDVEIHTIKREIGKALGDEARDLVYIPIAACRTFDTRTSTAGASFAGAVSPGSPKDAYVFWAGSSSLWLVYGGTVDSCPDTTRDNTALLAGALPYAVAMNVTVIGPAGTGWITAYRNDVADPSNTVVSKFVQNGVTDTALLIANVCRGTTGASCVADIKIATRGTTAHVAGDVVGYFIKPQATALQCVETASSEVIVAMGTYAEVTAPSCAAGYTQTGTHCASPLTTMPLMQVRQGACGARNNSAGVSGALSASRTCCRVPGR